MRSGGERIGWIARAVHDLFDPDQIETGIGRPHEPADRAPGPVRLELTRIIAERQGEDHTTGVCGARVATS